METVTVKNVDGPNENGWFEVELEDGRTATTKVRAIADAAMASRGTEVEAEVNTQQKGKFTNTYLNQINGVGESRNGSTASKGSTRRSAPQADDKQAVIEAEWSLGRAVELLVGSGQDYRFPLDKNTQDALVETAEFLRSKIR